MRGSQHAMRLMGMLALGTVVTSTPRAAAAHRLMSLKQAITYFLPEGSKPYRVTKTIPTDRLAEIRKRFELRSDDDFKETLPDGPHTVYLGRDASKAVTVYILILEQTWRTCHHQYAVGIAPDGAVQEVVVTELSCPYAYPINRKSFLKQFAGKEAADAEKRLAVGDGIDGVSGATRSSDVTAIVTRRALALYDAFFST